jgi:hypothetical protein
MSSKYIPPSLRNKEATSEMPPMQRSTAFSKPPRRPNNSSYWESRRRDEENEKKREAENAEKKMAEGLEYNETNFPSIIGGAPKTVTWSGRKFNDVIGDRPEETTTEVKKDEPPPFELPQFPNLRRRPRIICRSEDRDYYEDKADEYYQDDESEYFQYAGTVKSEDLPKESLDELDNLNDQGDGWTTVERKFKPPREKTMEEMFPEPEETVWGDEEDESCWDNGDRKLKN